MFKTMATLIKFLLDLGIISRPEELTQELIDQYECQITNEDLDAW